MASKQYDFMANYLLRQIKIRMVAFSSENQDETRNHREDLAKDFILSCDFSAVKPLSYNLIHGIRFSLFYLRSA